MKRIKQKHGTGCGIACVAMVARASYKNVLVKARELFDWPESQRSFYTTSAQLILLLAEYKIIAGRGRVVRRLPTISDLAIVGINHSSKNNTWHWVVFCRERGKEYVLDPRTKSDRRTDFNRMRLRSYIPIAI